MGWTIIWIKLEYGWNLLTINLSKNLNVHKYSTPESLTTLNTYLFSNLHNFPAILSN
jgi:hypothetical protein